MGNPNRRPHIRFGCAVVPSMPPDQAKETAPVKPLVIISKPKTVRHALLLTDRDMEKLGKNSYALIEGIARRSGCKIDILPKKEGDTECEVLFTGSPVVVAKAKTWVKEHLIPRAHNSSQTILDS
ncbi:hypothetical protein BKA64DRAFT_711668 [Cadophora sp. MPI-SDFR-AT-0126]|nr:hypothetical protein BKA64DRAFT_711668 [Leotiomycetes sp. MPI-SDFR-AT-0126]